MSRGTFAFLILIGLFLVIAHCAFLVSSAALADENVKPESQTEDEEALDPMGPNAACYICHITFLREELSQTHLLKAKVTCVECHGVSAGHANDENIGATKPDITYERDQVNAFCRECHENHDVAPEAIVARWLERELTQAPPICTDCHGMHRMHALKKSKESGNDRAGTTH